MNFSFNLPTTTTAQAQPAVQAGTNTSLSFGKPGTKPAFPLMTTKTTAVSATKPETPKTTFTIPASTMAAAAPTFSLPTAAAAAVAGTAPSKTTEAGKTTGFSLTTSTAGGGGPPAAVPSTPTATVPPSASMTYSQVEDLLNKWTGELAEQESLFHQQVSQVNGWDKILSENSAKLTKLHATIEKVQQQQKKINYDLDFVLQQQKELENAVAPLEKEYSSANYHPDVQRQRMYQTAENIDAQIKKMSEDVKETIEHVNETAPSQEKTHPILMIGRVLNAHMNTLQWIDENSAQLQSHIDSISRYLDNVKRENDRTFIPFQ